MKVLFSHLYKPGLKLTGLILVFLFGNSIHAQKEEIFLDDFNSNTNNWWLISDTDAGAVISEGKYILEYKKENSAYFFGTEINYNPQEDYYIEAKIKHNRGASNEFYGIGYGAMGIGNSYFFQVASNGSFQIGGYKNKNRFVQQEYTNSRAIFPKGTYNKLGIRKTGGIIKFYVNDRSVYQCAAGNFFGNYTGFVLNNRIQVEVDYLSIKYAKPKINLVGGINPSMKKKNLGTNINSAYSEIAPVISPDGQTLYVARQGHPANNGEEKLYDVWFSTRRNDGSWRPMERMGPPINNQGDNLVISVSPDGNTLLLEGIYSANGSYVSDQGISVSHKTQNGWTIPKKVVIQDFYNLNQYESYCPSVDRKVLIMSVERKDTYGQKDLYVSFLLPNGEYSKPLNMGEEINTYLNEGTPFLAPDNKTLYFYSHGHPGYGSADIFVTKRLDDTWTKWSKPKNMGPSINSSDWDTYYSISARGDFAYLVSARNSIGNEDVFEIKLTEEARPDPVVLVYGRVLNSKTKKPVGVDIVYEDLATSVKSGDARSNPGNGAYKIILPYGKAYAFRAQADNYFAVSEEIDLSKISTYKEIKRDLYLVPIEPGSVVNLQSVQFERNKADLVKSAYSELDRLVLIMKKYPKMEIEISGHTDTRGDKQLLLQLSSKRVVTVKNYLVRSGILSSRITARGYGGSRPLGTGSEEIEIKNRRVEFSIIKM